MRHSAALLEYDNIGHGFFGRSGGVSTGIYSSLNCGPGSDDDPDAIAENRQRVIYKIASTQQPLVSLHQVHSANVVAVTAPWENDNRPKADGMVTRTRNLALGILTADCCPVLLADNENGVIGAAHAGWRGALAGILPATIKAMIQIGANMANIRAAIGPTIQQESYEVGKDVQQAFMTADPQNGKFFRPAVRAEHFMFDLPGYTAHSLQQAGIHLYENLGMDTYPAENEFFSYRRRTHETHGTAQGNYGRQISAIILR
ncbi:MAG TPA: peptidoglycan editing factor PgeF [Alphaproteobacteria bacterium]|nr:peptidoglycan editing factor PgeF [Rhodospirillaceae bacterium]HRJ13070.1 peptidoglycan editing factor PgeF [Alphaproteobacteria bacterium]